MNCLKIGILSFTFLLSATFTFAQTETDPVLYGDKGGPEPELITEEVESLPEPEQISEEPVEEPVSDDTDSRVIWYVIAGVVVALAGAWILMGRSKGGTSGV